MRVVSPLRKEAPAKVDSFDRGFPTKGRPPQADVSRKLAIGCQTEVGIKGRGEQGSLFKELLPLPPRSLWPGGSFRHRHPGGA